MASPFSPDNMRKRFVEAGTERDAILAKSTPLRAERDRLQNEAAEKVAALNAKIMQIEAPLYEIDTERGALARALGGKTGMPVEEGKAA